jgi:hypothetical protein
VYERCPRCGASQVEPVVYALGAERPTPRRHVELGADLAWHRPALDRESPNFRCLRCGHGWPDPRRLEAAAEIRAHFEGLRRGSDP